MEFIKSNFATLIGLLLPIGITLLTLYFIIKSQSAASVYNKLWSLFYGEKDFYSEKINSFAKKQHDIDKFNFVYGFRFQSKEQIESFLEWIERRNYQIYWFSHLGTFFDKNSFDVRSTSNLVRFITFILGVGAIAFFVFWISYRDFSGSKHSLPVIEYFISYIYAIEIIAFTSIILFLSKVQNKANKAILKMRDQEFENAQKIINERNN